MKILYMDCFLGFSAQMLLGALVDAGLSTDALTMRLKEIDPTLSVMVQNTERASINCKKVTLLSDNAGNHSYSSAAEDLANEYGYSDETTPMYIDAVIAAIKELDIEYIITSDVSLGETVDGKVIELLENAGIVTMPSDESCDNIHPTDAAFLGYIANECGPRPDMHIIAIGYGAGGTDTQKPNIVSAIIGEFNSDIFFDAKDYEELTASL